MVNFSSSYLSNGDLVHRERLEHKISFVIVLESKLFVREIHQSHMFMIAWYFFNVLIIRQVGSNQITAKLFRGPDRN